VACIWRLIYNCTNVILIAQTGFSKSLILQAVSILCKGTILLIFLPLNEIAKDQVQKVNKVGGNALFLNADIKNREQAIETTKTGKYTHIFTSPELASTLSFCSLLQDLSFKKQLALVVVDEAHLIVYWNKKFHSVYGELHYIHNLIGNITP